MTKPQEFITTESREQLKIISKEQTSFKIEKRVRNFVII